MLIPQKTLLTIFLLLIVLMPAVVFADDFRVVPSLTLREEYNDRITGGDDEKEGDFITRIAPALKVKNRTERSDLDFSARLTQFFYADKNYKDHLDQTYRGTCDYRISELAGLNMSAGFDVSHRPDRDLETTGFVVSDNRRERQDYGAGFNCTLSELSAVSFSGGYSGEKWSKNTSDQQDLEAFRVAANLSHNLGQWKDATIGRFNMGFSRYEYETSTTDYYYTTIGLQHWFTETVSLLVDLGARYTDADYLAARLVWVLPFLPAIQLFEENSKAFGGMGSAVLEITGELTRGSIRVGHDIQAGGSRGSTVQRSEAVVNLNRRLAEKSSLSFSMGYFRNKSDSDNYAYGDIDEEAFFVRPSIRWGFMEKFTLEGGYHFSYTDDQADNDTWKRNLVYIQLGYRL